MLTDRDIAIKVVAEGKDPEATTVREIATTRIVAIDPDQEHRRGDAADGQNQVDACLSSRRTAGSSGVIAQADVAEHASAKETGKVVEEISR